MSFGVFFQETRRTDDPNPENEDSTDTGDEDSDGVHQNDNPLEDDSDTDWSFLSRLKFRLLIKITFEDYVRDHFSCFSFFPVLSFCLFFDKCVLSSCLQM